MAKPYQAIDTTKTGPGAPVLDQNYKITPSAFQNTTNRDGNIHAAFAAGDIELILANVNEPGIEFTGVKPYKKCSLLTRWMLILILIGQICMD